MRRFFDPSQLPHDPPNQLHKGSFVSYAEVTARAETIARAGARTEAPKDFGLAPILAVHDSAYLDFLRDAPGLWREACRPGEAIPHGWPVMARRALTLNRVDALLGGFSFDAATPITAATWNAAYLSAQTALGATQAVLDGARHSFALCRSPGHHAGRDHFGGYCNINAAAISAEYACDADIAHVAILDIDYQHGNGTQDIFWTRGDVFYASLHADLATDYPFFWGHADETGSGVGQGTTLNLPLPRSTALPAFRVAQESALEAIARFGAELLVVSFGVDTWEGDPMSHFKLTTEDYAVFATDIAARGWPTIIVLEGGYATDVLGSNVTSFPSGFADA